MRKTVHTIFFAVFALFSRFFFLPFISTQMAYQTDNEDSDSDYENLGDILIGDLDENSLQIEHETLDDLFTGSFPPIHD